MDRRAIALKAILNDCDAKLIAKVNHRDNFTYWAAPIAWDAIMGTFQNIAKGDDAEAAEYNQICKDATAKINGYDYMYSTNSKLIISICHEAYEELQASW